MQRSTPTPTLGYLPRPGTGLIEANNGPLFVRAQSAPASLPGDQVISLPFNNPYKATNVGVASSEYDPTSPPYVPTSPVYSAATSPSYVPSTGEESQGAGSPDYTPVSPVPSPVLTPVATRTSDDIPVIDPQNIPHSIADVVDSESDLEILFEIPKAPPKHIGHSKAITFPLGLTGSEAKKQIKLLSRKIARNTNALFIQRHGISIETVKCYTCEKKTVGDRRCLLYSGLGCARCSFQGIKCPLKERKMTPAERVRAAIELRKELKGII
ncbi:hypothetical protein TREMEDRAFT_65473 [Tremella mesenterica DSM 1558]|uniref:uncharacterized protein n=1 Tax=Tremella mesenterica (strain ATCC 24925 / CBS 8224 / DSM 1558 / NBRC 9311 / NRRL Y-6157 / RJB 2259-6 / UBC 559-6) TaxID=578456 RepID=UPI00032CB3E2|nr:uncharacterized protein TREMEDRAFT_65473 [Tremella mesenterica DSM 1558]EIW66602.1 hypothetical protein TREMEDRAFT_65473 [Tremella mesenterica DSM 1558]